MPQNLSEGRIVRTSYNTGPYVITRVDGPCTCPEYLVKINLAYLSDDHPGRVSEPHYHLACRRLDEKTPRYSLGGYRDDGSNVWNDDRLIFEDIAAGTQASLF